MGKLNQISNSNNPILGGTELQSIEYLLAEFKPQKQYSSEVEPRLSFEPEAFKSTRSRARQCLDRLDYDPQAVCSSGFVQIREPNFPSTKLIIILYQYQPNSPVLTQPIALLSSISSPRQKPEPQLATWRDKVQEAIMGPTLPPPHWFSPANGTNPKFLFPRPFTYPTLSNIQHPPQPMASAPLPPTTTAAAAHHPPYKLPFHHQNLPFLRSPSRAARSPTKLHVSSTPNPPVTSTSASSSSVATSKPKEETIFFDGGAHYGDLVANLLLGFTLLWLPLTLAAVSRAFFLRYRFTNLRVTVISGLTGQDRSDFSYKVIKDVQVVPRFIGEWGDVIITLRDGTKVDLRSVPRFRELAKYCLAMAEKPVVLKEKGPKGF
ncbi:uncharacterized protein LOC116212251 [Punica granatum]|uniref:Uncharacterized protein LOC116212251 n=2 Tax=Punica granatum TaxID=22663 RepID=A0A6P8DYP4_PUNGR|nr:uncharacterized protein LOC116212251 [Punica granatum]PKI36850.1 hypothetical protein CRG98_042799 [Punica granatum]